MHKITKLVEQKQLSLCNFTIVMKRYYSVDYSVDARLDLEPDLCST